MIDFNREYYELRDMLARAPVVGSVDPPSHPNCPCTLYGAPFTPSDLFEGGSVEMTVSYVTDEEAQRLGELLFGDEPEDFEPEPDEEEQW